MRSSRRCADDTGCYRLAAAEDFDVNPLRRHAQSGHRFFHVRHKASRPAEIDIRLPWEADLFEDGSRQMACSVEIFTDVVARVRPAVTNIAAAARKREHEATDFSDEWMMVPIASCVQPQDLPYRAGRRQRVQHR